MSLVGEDAWEAMSLSRLFEKGLPPVGAGAIEQTESFLQAHERIAAEDAAWKAKLKVRR